MQELIPIGSLAGWKIDKEKHNNMLDEYFKFMVGINILVPC